MKIQCAVIEDLLPLYVDGVCSEESKIILEEHLKECSGCREKLKAQKEALTLSDEVVKENLQAKEPFKKIEKHQQIKLIAIIVAIPLLWLSFLEIRGDGLGFSALYGRYKAERFLSNIEKGNYQAAARNVKYSGGVYASIGSDDKAQKEWAKGMEELKNEGIEFVGHKNNEIVTDDGFTSGEVIVSVQYKYIVYYFELFISTNSGKIETGNLSYKIKNPAYGPNETEKMLMNKISTVISTYNPG